MIDVRNTPIRTNGGIGRFWWIVGTSVCAVMINSKEVIPDDLVHWDDLNTADRFWSVLRAYGVLTAQTCLVSLRFKNIGYRSMFSLLTVVPPLNLGIALACMTLPENHIISKRFDMWSKAALSLVVLLLAFLLWQFGIGLASMGHGHASTDPVVVFLLNKSYFVWKYSIQLIAIPLAFGVLSIVGTFAIMALILVVTGIRENRPPMSSTK